MSQREPLSHRDEHSRHTDAASGEPYGVVYFGTPSYAVPTLEALARDRRFDVRLVVTQPDRPAGRRRALLSPPVKQAAIDLALPVYQPDTLRTPASRAPLQEADATLFIVAAYGLIFGRQTLGIPRAGSLNLHASLLPHYRGASPVCAAILEGDAETGVTLMVMERGLDCGPIVGANAIPIAADDTTQSLTEKLGYLAADVALDLIPPYLDGSVIPEPQSGPYSVVRQLIKADGWIDWSQPARRLERQVRAMWDWPRAWTSYEGSPIQVHRASVASEEPGLAPGEFRTHGAGVVVACGEGALLLERVQPAGKGPMDAVAWVNGLRSEGRLRFDVDAQPAVPSPLIQYFG